MLPKTRSVRAVVVTAFVLGATLPLLAAMAADSQRDAMASPAPQSTSVPPSGTPQQAAAPAGAPASSAATTPTATEAAETDTSHNQDGIVAIVNDHPISEYDLRQRMALVMSTSNIPQTPEMRKKIHDQVLESLRGIDPTSGPVASGGFCMHKVFQRVWWVDLSAKSLVRGYGWAGACAGC